MTQNQQILRHLLIHGKITARDAYLEYGILRLSARVYDLRKMGYLIDNRRVTYKQGKRCKHYDEYIFRGRAA